MASPAGDSAHDRSSSGTGSRASSSRKPRGTLRVKPSKSRSSGLGSGSTPGRHASPSDENSLTSFPSLSPSVANSPETTTRATTAAVDRKLASGQNSSTALQELFTTADGGERGALFEDAPVRSIPGAMHHMGDAHVEHLIARVGATTLVKQLAQDLAQRDAQVTTLQRRAEERERLLRRMLRDCEVSNLDIENRLKELEQDRAKERKVSGKSLASEHSAQSGNSIDEQIEDAFEDVWGGHEVRNGGSETDRREPAKNNPTPRTAESHPLEGGDTVRGLTTNKGWSRFFGGGGSTARQSNVSRNTARKTESAQQRLSAIHTASQKNVKRKGLSSDLFQPPPHTDDEGSVATASDDEHDSANLERVGTDNSENVSVKSANSVASWAMKLVGGGGNPAQADMSKTLQDRRASLNRLNGGGGRSASPLSRTTAQQLAEQRTKHPKSRTPSVAIGPNGTLKRPGAEHRNTAGLLMVGSPNQAAASTTDEQGPTEMETILPDEIRPPTLAPSEFVFGRSNVLTDRFGFIYDNNRRVRHAARGKNESRVETLENHRRSFNTYANEEDAISISSQADKRPTSPGPGPNLGEPAPPKRWQDYLKLTSIGGGELLSHTPSAVPVTDIVTGNDDTPRKATPTISISKTGLDPTKKSEPTASRVVSANAEPTLAGNQELQSTGEADDNDSAKALLDQLTEVHDRLQKERTVKWDDFLKKIRTERARNGEIGTAVDRRSKRAGVPEASWTDGEIIGIAGLGNEGKVGRAKWLEFKNLVLGGIPVAYRAKIWAECSGATGLRIPGFYDELVANKAADDPSVVRQIKMDINRTLMDNIFFLEGKGLQKLEEILTAYARHNPDIGYCQGMNMITANLLLIMPTAEDAFWILIALIDHILPEKYYDHSLLASRADQTVLRNYVTTILPQLSAHLEALSVDLEALTFQWFLAVFTGALSAEALFRVWDVIFCTQDGATFLFQVALALLKLNERNLLDCDTPSAVYTYINHHMTDHAVSIDGLIRASEGLKKFVKREEVTKKRSAVVAAELEANREREAIRKGKARAVDPPPSKLASVERPPAGKDGDTGSRRASVIPVVEPNDQYEGELEYRSPMPVEEEVEWRA